ncbi:hypothetical protein QQZ08_001077 [Neonectria magnoliae]|uniref:Uncharacterized protein n=1 Tax=Neonectria magnoliae TaxID=2732573 RepID=A0ABR1IIE4_9HYPO
MRTKKLHTALRVNTDTNDLEFVPLPSTAVPGVNELRYFKFSLMGPHPWFDSPNNEAIKSLLVENLSAFTVGLSTAKVVAIFLKGLWDVVVKEAGLEHFMAMTPNLPLHTVVTYPCCWSEETLNRLKEAVNLSGITGDNNNEVSYCSEHEAAIHAVLFDQPNLSQRLSKDGHSIIVADCGGISIDAATYQFGSVTSGQSTSGSIVDWASQLNGSLGLDLAFTNLLSREIQRVTGLCDSELTPEILRDKKTALGYWHRDEMIKIFDDLINPIVAVILKLFKAAQVKKNTPKFLVLTGGLGCNDHVKLQIGDLLRRHLGNDAPEFIDQDKILA